MAREFPLEHLARNLVARRVCDNGHFRVCSQGTTAAPTRCRNGRTGAVRVGWLAHYRNARSAITRRQRSSVVRTGSNGARRACTVSMISALSMPWRYTDVMPRLLWPSWRWMTTSGTPSWASSRGVRVAQLVRGKAAPDASGRRGVAQLRASGRDRPAPAARRTGDDAEQRPDGKLYPGGEPRLQLLPGPVVHADLAPAAALAATDQHGAPPRVKISLGERERLADPQPGAPEHDDQGAQAPPVDRLAGGAHDRDDLLDRGRVRRVADPLVAWRATGVESRQRGGRAATTGGIEQTLGHLVLLRTAVFAAEDARLARPSGYRSVAKAVGAPVRLVAPPLSMGSD